MYVGDEEKRVRGREWEDKHRIRIRYLHRIRPEAAALKLLPTGGRQAKVGPTIDWARLSGLVL